MVFHEITKDAIQDAVHHTRDLDESLVDAQETRRVLDRLYGWDVFARLWRKVGSGREGTALSAGPRAVRRHRMVVERERERMAFVSATYWASRRWHPVGLVVHDASEPPRRAPLARGVATTTTTESSRGRRRPR